MKWKKERLICLCKMLGGTPYLEMIMGLTLQNKGLGLIVKISS
jgi:hypothetical protein